MSERSQPPARLDDALRVDAAQQDALDAELRALPELDAPADLWQRIRVRTDAADTTQRVARRRALTRRWQAPLAVAASVLVVCALALHVSLRQPPGPSATVDDGDLEALLERSRLIEARRRSLPVLVAPTGGERVLRARIGDIDVSLNHLLLDDNNPQARQRLLQQRVDLLESLMHIEQHRQHELVRHAVF